MIVPELLVGRDAIVVAHGNSLRALVKYLEGVSDDDIVGLNIPTGIPRLYDLASDLSVVERSLSSAIPPPQRRPSRNRLSRSTADPAAG